MNENNIILIILGLVALIGLVGLVLVNPSSTGKAVDDWEADITGQAVDDYTGSYEIADDSTADSDNQLTGDLSAKKLVKKASKSVKKVTKKASKTIKKVTRKFGKELKGSMIARNKNGGLTAIKGPPPSAATVKPGEPCTPKTCSRCGGEDRGCGLWCEDVDCSSECTSNNAGQKALCDLLVGPTQELLPTPEPELPQDVAVEQPADEVVTEG